MTKLKTKKTAFIVIGTERTYVWLEVLHGNDKGIRVRVPRYHLKYSQVTKDFIDRMEEGNVVTCALVSDVEPPSWRVKELDR